MEMVEKIIALVVAAGIILFLYSWVTGFFQDAIDAFMDIFGGWI